MVAVALTGRREQKLVGMVQRLLKNRHRGGSNAGAVAAVQHLVEMPQKAEARHIRAGVDMVFPAAVGGILIEGGHRVDGGLHGRLACLAHAVGGAEDAHAQPLGQQELIALSGSVIGVDMRRMHRAHDGQAVLHVGIGDGMAAYQRAAGLGHLFRAAPHHFAQNV